MIMWKQRQIFLYLGDRIYLVTGCDAAVTSKTKLGWPKFRDCHDFLCGKRSSEDHRKCIQWLCEISSAPRRRDVVLRSVCDMDFAKNRMSHVEQYAWGEINGLEVDERSNADVGFEWNNRSAGEG